MKDISSYDVIELRAEIARLREADKVRMTVHEAEIRRLGIAMGMQADDNARLQADHEKLVYIIGLARGKLTAYRQAHGGGCVGGIEFTALDKLIESALAAKEPEL